MSTDAKPQKSTIYLDAEDEITAIIEKVKSAHGSIVAVVPPKRAAVLQSVVNLKLLQRAARTAKKNLVLVTTDPSLLPLAGTVGMMVAKTTSSKPEVPPAPDAPATPEDADEVVETGEEPIIDSAKSVGELAGAGAAAKAASKDEVETVELDDPAPPTDTTGKKSKKDKKAGKPDKKLKVPNFNTFRKKMLLACGGLVLLIVLFVFANVVLPSATIIIKADTASVQTNLNVAARTSATSVDAENLVIPLIREEFRKTDSEKAPATGKRDDGSRASGSVSFTNCTDSPATVPTGTTVSSGSVSFVTQGAVALDAGNFTGGGVCKDTGSHVGTTNVVAAENGDKFNVGAQSYKVSGGGGDIRAYGSTMSGGTSKIVKIVSQSDIDGAKQKVLDRIKNDGEGELKSKFDQQGAIGIKETLKAGDPVVTSSPNANGEGDEVSVTVAVTYTQAAVKRDDVNKLIETDVNRQIDSTKQQIQNTGLDSAVMRVTSDGQNELRFQLQSVSQVGPQLDTEGIKQQIAGKKRGETTSLIMARPGVKDVEINYSPFWVHGTPSRTNKITITFESANAQ